MVRADVDVYAVFDCIFGCKAPDLILFGSTIDEGAVPLSIRFAVVFNPTTPNLGCASRPTLYARCELAAWMKLLLPFEFCELA